MVCAAALKTRVALCSVCDCTYGLFWAGLRYLVAAGPEGRLAEQGIFELPWYDQYLDNYYTTLMMVMGDTIHPKTKAETFFASFIVLLGACMNATIFANVASYVSQVGT